MADLQLNLKPIVQQSFSSMNSLPQNVHSLFTSVKRAAAGFGVVPAEIGDRFVRRLRATDDELLPHNLYEHVNLEDASAPRRRRLPETIAACRRELSVLAGVTGTTREWMAENVSEAAWHSLVHGPLLNIAINGPADPDDYDDDDTDAEEGDVNQTRGARSVSFWDITSARTHAAYLPRNAGGNPLEGKMVDFCLTVSDLDVQAAARRTLQASIAAFTQDSLIDHSINHTDYEPLTLRPVSISMETEASNGGTQEGKAQLSVWAATHFARLRALKSFKRRQDRDAQRDECYHGGAPSPEDEAISMALPLLLTSGSRWRLFFALDRRDTIAVLETITIGDTDTLIGCYKVVAALRDLAAWSETTFRTWLMKEVLLS
ncbi:hypothetical protein QQX98_012016 [Neonectria punicea]|uniref:PD-(D/E)XK nuclease-like domain-containing protein n=1 Tax=Neonectria punicea TaxID=979145 RepID=A0ABR1GK03_9HYPO